MWWNLECISGLLSHLLIVRSSPFRSSFSLFPFILGPSLPPGWTRLPRPPCGCSIDNRRHLCTGCWKPLTTTDLTYSCLFCDTGFQVADFKARPCCTRYHVGCISVGLPFLTRLQARKGLFCPRDLARQRHFVCEACTVRAVLQEELGFFAWDFALLMLERVRLVDISNKWAASTLKNYQSKFNVFSEFDRVFHTTSL